METNQLASSDIKIKAHFTGTVVKIGLAGAVIDIGTPQPAAIHVSQIITPDNQPIKRVEDVLQVGQQVDVWVRRIKEGRIELTMIKPLDLEWREILPEMVVKGTVVRLEKFGAFVEIGAERPGLIHISEMSHEYVRQPSDVVKEGEQIEAKVLEVNRKKKQIKLSIKALQIPPEPVEVEPPVEVPIVVEKREKPSRRRRGQQQEETELTADMVKEMQSSQENETDTALGIALREAMQKNKATRKQIERFKRQKSSNKQDQDDLLSRTLGQRQSS